MFKSRKSLVVTCIILLIAAIVGWGSYYLQTKPKPDNNTPPVLKLTNSDSTKFQGFTYNKGDELIFKTALSDGFQLTAEESTALEALEGKYDLVSFPPEFNSIKAGAAYYYAVDKLPIKNAMALLLKKSPKGNEILLAYYDSDSVIYKINPPAKTNVEKALFDQIGVENLDDSFVIPALHPFVIYSKLPFDGPNSIFTAKAALNSAGIFGVDTDVNAVMVLGTNTPSDGWYLVPRNHFLDMEMFLDGLENVRSYYIQTDFNTFGNACYVGKSCTDEYSKFYFVWINIGSKVDGAMKIPAFCDQNPCLSDNSVQPADILQLTCESHPELCNQYNVVGGIGDPSLLINDTFKNPGWVDPVPFENKVGNAISDPLVLAGVIGIKTDPLNGLNDANKIDLRDTFTKTIGLQSKTLADNILGNEFMKELNASDDFQNAYDVIQKFEKDNNTKVSQEDAARYIGLIIKNTLTEAAQNADEIVTDAAAFKTILGQIFSANSDLKTEFSDILNTTFDSFIKSSNLNLKYDNFSKSFVELGGAVKLK